LRILWKGAQGWRWPDRDPRSVPPDILFGLDVRPESLPADLAGIAAAAARTDPRQALSLLYRGALSTLIHRDRLEIDAGDTEGDCVHAVQRSSAQELAAYFARLVAAWSHTAYGGRAPEPGRIDAL